MVLAEAARSRLLASLRPWLAAEPEELEVQVGFLRSRAVARRLELDAVALNAAVPATWPVAFDRAAAAEVELIASPWCAPALSAVVRGVDVVLTLREPVPKKRPDFKEWVSKEKQRVIASFDPQGELLHEMIQGAVRSLEEKFTSTFSNIFLNCSQVWLANVTIQVQYLDSSHLLILRTDDLKFGPELVFRSSLFRGLVGSSMSSRKKNNLFVKCADFEFLLKENDHIDCSASFTGVTASVRLDNLQLAAFSIHVPSAYWKFSPEAIPSLIVILDIATQKEDLSVRNGRDLWKIAAQKIDNSILGRRFSLRKVIGYAALWQHYVHAYILLLSLVGYPFEKIIKRNCGKVSSNRKIWESIRDHLKIVVDLEEKIPAEAIARARCAARSKLFVSQQQSKQESSKTLLVSSISKILSPILYIWRFVLSICWSALSILGFRHKPYRSSVYVSLGVSHDSDVELQLSLHLGELCVTLLPFADRKRLIQENKTNNISLPSTRLVMKSCYLLYSVGCTTQSFFFVIGELNACLCGIPKLLRADSSTILQKNPSFGTTDLAKDIDSKIILWSDPASLHPFSGRPANESLSHADDSFTTLLQSDMEELWSNWITISSLYDESGVMHHEKPFAIFEFRYFLVDPYKSICGFQKCRFTIGKLSLDLDYFCTLSTYLLFRQFEHYKQLKGRIEKSGNLSDCSAVCVKPESGEIGRLRSFTHRMKIVTSNAVPENTIHIAALVAGPNIQLSLERNNLFNNSKNDKFSQRNIKSCIVLNLTYVECAIWPASPSLPTAPIANLSVKESQNKFCGVEELQSSHHLVAERSATYACPGHIVLDAFFKFAGLAVLVDNLEANQQFHIFGPMSANFQFSTSRKYVHSFFAARNVLSIDLRGGIIGCIAFFYIDEFFTICQLSESMQVAALNSELVNVSYSQEFARRVASFCNKNMNGSTMESGVVYTTQEIMIDSHTELMVDMTLDLESIDIFFNGSRDRHPPNPAVFLNSAINYISSSPAFEGVATQELLDILALGVGFCIRSSSAKLLLDGQCTNFLVNFSGIQSVVFDNQAQMSICNDILQYRTMLNSSLHNKNQFILSKCVLHLCVGSNEDILTDKKLLDKSSGSNCTTASVGIFYFLEFEFTEVYIGDYSLHARLTEVNQSSKQKISLLIHDDLQYVKCKIQGGLIFLETRTLSKFVLCCKMYFWLLVNLPLWASSNLGENSVSPISEGLALGFTNKSREREVANASTGSTAFHSECEESLLNAVKDADVDLSQFSLTLAVADGCGTYQGLTLQTDMSLQRLNFGTKILFELKNLSISSTSMLKNSPVQSSDILVPRFRSSKSFDLPSQAEIREHHPVMVGQDMLIYDHDAPSTSTSAMKSSTGNTSEFSSYDNYILRHFSASVKIEKKHLDSDSSLVQLSGDWFGNGSFSGLEVIMTLSSIKMISELLAPLRGMLSASSVQEEIQTGDTTHQEQPYNIGSIIPDGAVVAIRDLDQQMYVSVKGTGGKYQVVGACHYSLAGERALFKVRHHKRWTLEAPCISLVSLYAKTDGSKEMSLKFSQGSDFVVVSSVTDKSHSLWRMFPLRLDGCEDDGDDGKSCKIVSKNSYHLVNKKNNYGLAFVDGLLEFVRKPGNPFKVKVFDESLFSNVARLIVPSMNMDDPVALDVEDELSCAVRDRLETDATPQHINISVDNIVFTILHEVLDTDNVCPLVQKCISDVCVVMQIFPSKIRILSSFKVSGKYFDAQRILWRELVSPITSYVFFRSRFLNQDSATRYRRNPLRFFLCLKQVDIFINELLVDILLYLAGKLDLMGPYAVRSTALFPNCCKIENNSRLALVCHFQNNGDVIVPGQQSASVFLRHLSFEDKVPHGQSAVSLSLVKEGVFSTSSIDISLQDSSIFAWRTRVSSLKDSRSFSGPFVVAEVSQNSEEGLSVSVYPLLRIYNKSDFTLELRFHRPNEANEEAAFVTLRSGDMVDESTGVFDAIDLSGGSKRALMSLALGNFLLSIRPDISEHSENFGQPVLVNWSEDIMGEKAVLISGVLEKLNYNLRRALSADSMKSFFRSLRCPVFVNGECVTDLHFLIHTVGRDVPLQPPNGSRVSDRSTPVALQFQREIFVYPTVQVYNFLQTDIHVLLTEYQLENMREDEFNFGNLGKQAMIASGSSAYFYVNPAMFNLSVTLISYGSKSKPVNSSDWVKRLQKQTARAQLLDVELEFVPGKYYSSLRLLCQEKGLLEVALFTKYALHNTSEYPLLCTASYHKSLPRSESGKDTINLPPQHGCILPSMSMNSWFTKSSRVYISLHNEKTSESCIDLEVLSGFTEFFLEIEDDVLPNRMASFGMSLQPVHYDLPVPSQVVQIVPRYVISNESTNSISVRQCFVEDDIDGLTIEGKQRVSLQTWKPGKKREINYFDSFLKKHRNVSEDSHIFIQFSPKETGYSWSGPICVSSIGRFFLKFRRSQDMVTDGTRQVTLQDGKLKQFASVDVVQAATTFVLHFNKPPKAALPYRIENFLHKASVIYFQKDSIESDVLHPRESEQFAWDDLSLPHKLVVRIVDTPALREIKIDKISSWKPFLKMRQNSRLNLDFSFNNGLSLGKQGFDESYGLGIFKIGYEVYADGLTRVLRICEHVDIPKAEKIQRPIASLQFRISYMCIHLLEKGQSEEMAQSPSTILTVRLQHVSVDSVIADRYKHVSAAILSINMDEKWEGASFGSILRRSQLDNASINESILHIIFILNSTNSSVKQVKYCSITLQPIDLKVDEETLMKLVPFWRTSLAPSGTPSTQFYFRQFEVHPIKVITSFRPGSPHTTYSSAQEVLRALLHSVIKVPEISNSVVELNGVLLSHALVTFRELFLKCTQHYSWYILRAIYLTKGTSLLPPSFASIFDDSASSVLDVFFDPSYGSLNLPGLTIGMFKFIRQNMKSGGFSGTKRYLGDLGKTVKTASSNALFAAVSEISDNIVRGAETNGFNGMVTGFHQGILRLAMEPSVLGLAIMEGGPDRKIKLDHSPGLDELYIEGYLQAMLDVIYKQEYLRVRVIDDQVVLKNLPPNSALINEIVENVKSFLMSRALLKGDGSTIQPLRHLRNEAEWRIAPTVLTLCEHLFVSFAVRTLHREATKAIAGIMLKVRKPAEGKGQSSSSGALSKRRKVWTVGRFAVSGMVAYVDGRLCRHIPNPIARRIVSGFLLSFIDRKDGE